MVAELGAWVAGVLAANTASIDAAARAIVRTHHLGGLVYTAGSGHSMAMVMETFFRAGGLAMVRPLQDPVLFPLNGAQASTAAEREAGLGVRVVADAGITEADTVVVFSNSGRNPYPVEVAMGAGASGACTIAFTSVATSRGAAPRGPARLFEVADIVLDTLTPPGDVSRPADQPVTAPLSTIACAVLWAEILARVVELDPGVPLWRSANADGNDDHNARLVKQLSERIPEL